MEANEIKEAMAFFAIIFNRGDGFWARRWKFFELINNRGDTIIRSHRVVWKKICTADGMFAKGVSGK